MRLWLLPLIFFPFFAHAAELQVLSQSTTSWDGGELKYPEGKPQITIARLTLKPGDVMPFHCHPVPSAGYVISGHLKVELADGRTHEFKTGEPITEVMGTAHRGHNLSDKEPVELFVVYAGAEGVKNTLTQAECGK